jgi:prephenate dehydrogenase
MSKGSPHIAVFGPGLMGASLLMALRAKSPEAKLSVWARRPAAVQEVISRGLADTGSTEVPAVVGEADIVVLCLPVDRMADLAAAIAPHAKPEALVTDVGSTKEKPVADLEKIFARDRNFVGSHPMCGSEESGMGAARADLYEGAVCVVCPTAASRPEMVRQAETLWKTAGGRVTLLPPAAHDEAVAAVSHTPHVVAAALVELAALAHEDHRQLCATGFRDTTRIAAGSPELWSAILSDNAEKTAAALEKMEAILAGYRELLTAGHRAELARKLAAAAEARAQIFPNH